MAHLSVCLYREDICVKLGRLFFILKCFSVLTILGITANKVIEWESQFPVKVLHVQGLHG